MIKSVLIANRGEIACRIIKTAKALGIETSVIYTKNDQQSLAVQQADKAFPLDTVSDFLNPQKIISIAKEAGAEAIHPGYGFLSENASFAEECRKEKLIFIGPPSQALKLMGSKREAKYLAKKLDIPVIPGATGSSSSLAKEADELGYPLMIKAALGGGGKGLRRVDAPQDFQQALETCQREAQNAFGSAEVILEKYLPLPRHIEVQIFRDSFGNAVHLFDRECSLQRHHQKVIEEAPSSLRGELKQKLREAALKLAHEINYINAGTVEFLVDQDDNFYFMEMNTRLQVEHPVTEAITGLDLVEWQFRVSSNQKLPLKQNDIQERGHSLELRLYAEDPQENFKPTSGKIWFQKTPSDVRIDTGLHEKDTVTSLYDPLLAKLIVHGENREEAIQKALLAMDEWVILGLKTNASFLKYLLLDQRFQNNQIDVGFIDRNLPQFLSHKIPEIIKRAGAYIKVLLPEGPQTSPWLVPHNWRLEGYAPRVFEWSCEAEKVTQTLRFGPEDWGPESALLTPECLQLGDKEIPYWDQGEILSLFYQGETFNLKPLKVVNTVKDKRVEKDHITAPMTGKISLILVKENEIVNENQPLIILEAMKMEHLIPAPHSGKVKKIFFDLGDVVEEGSELILLDEKKEIPHGHA